MIIKLSPINLLYLNSLMVRFRYSVWRGSSDALRQTRSVRRNRPFYIKSAIYFSGVYFDNILHLFFILFETIELMFKITKFIF